MHQTGGDRFQVIHRQAEGHEYDYYQMHGKTGACDTSSASPPRRLTLVCQRQQSHSSPHSLFDRSRHHRHTRHRCLPFCDHYDLRQTALPSPQPLVILLLLFMASPSFLSPGRLCSFVAMADAAAAAAPAAATASSAGFGGAITSRSSGLDSPLYSSGYPFMGERRLSSRTVTTKYGSLRGVTLTLPNRSLQPIEVFLGMAITHTRELKVFRSPRHLCNEEDEESRQASGIDAESESVVKRWVSGEPLVGEFPSSEDIKSCHRMV